MAMALSRTMAPTTALPSQRRRRAAASPTNATANANASAFGTRRRRATDGANASNGLGGGEEEEKTGDAAAEARPSVRFARFDTALRHSDQTITGGAASLASSNPWRRRSEDAPPFGLATTRTRSSFFPDSTDDEDTGRADGVAALGMRVSFRRDASAQPTGASTPTFPVIHIGDVQFPTTRTVLWDRRVLAGPFELTTADVLPRVRLTNAVLKQLNALAVDKTHSRSRLLGYAADTDASAATRDECDVVTLSTLVHHKPEGERSRGWWVPMYRDKPAHQEDDAADQEAMETAARARYESSSSTRTIQRGGPPTLPVEVRGIVSKSAQRSHAEIDVEISMVVPSVHLQFRLIRSLPLLMTPLAASLLRCEFGSEVQRFGYLTLDRARKAVPLLETDPLVLQRPIVGIWVYGIDIDDVSAAESIHVRHPYLFESSVRFLSSKIIKERAQVDADTFLVAVYPGNAAGPLPRFFECRASRSARSSSAVEWTSALARGRCLAGVSSFKNDLELILVLTPEGFEQSTQPAEVKVKSAPRGNVEEIADIEERRPYRETYQSTKNGSIQHGLTVAEPTAPDSMRSCCRSQRIIASQHQQMLENQQRQLRDLQEQIAQLQRVLTDTRAENARLLAASSSRSSSSSHVDDDADHKQERASPEPHRDVETDSAAAQPTLEDDEEHVQEEHNVENDTSMVSSLALSSISAGSSPSELSSVSSSLVGSRLKTLLTTDPTDAELAQGQDAAAPDEGTKHAGSPREPQTVCATASEVPPRIHAGDAEDGNVPDDRASDDDAAASDDEGFVRRSCPFVPSIRGNLKRRAQCERDEFEDESDASKINELLAERLRIPNTPNREEIVRSGSLATLGFSHGSSFSIPKIKYVPEIVTCDSDDDEEEEIRRIELKYRTRRVH